VTLAGGKLEFMSSSQCHVEGDVAMASLYETLDFISLIMHCRTTHPILAMDLLISEAIQHLKTTLESGGPATRF